MLSKGHLTSHSRIKKESEKAGLKLNIQKMKIMASGPITPWQIEGGKSGSSDRFYILGLQKSLWTVTAAMELRHLLTGRKPMTNLDSTLKSKDITLPAKAHIVKAMIFPVVMHACDSWTIQKAEH